MDKKLLLFLLLSTALNTIAQNDNKAFYGIISDDLGILPNAHIINETTKNATYTNDNGEFRIFVKIGDSLKITSVGYKTIFVKTSEKHFGMTNNHFKMIKEIVELDEVEVKKHNLIGSLSSDIKQIKNTELINASSLNLPNANKRKFTPAERKLYTAKGGGSLLSVDYLINTLSGSIKKLKEEKRNEDEEKELNYLKEHFKNYLLHDLKIDSLEINLFISYFQSDVNYNEHKQKGEFYLIDFIRKKSIEFKELDNH